MPKEKARKKVEVHLNSVDILSKSLFQSPDEAFDIELIDFNILTEQKVNFEDKLVFIGVKVDIILDNKNEALFQIYTASIFEIPEFDNYVKKRGTKFTISDDLIDHLTDIAISTTRGIIYSELRGTYLDEALLPVVNQDDFELVQSHK